MIKINPQRKPSKSYKMSDIVTAAQEAMKKEVIADGEALIKKEINLSPKRTAEVDRIAEILSRYVLKEVLKEKG
ncbi:hypothetical protein A3J90_00615 [candidate division WOR-1 bacterium RIFOXYC2_FULL_37_10]|uniref:Uncharacterized protein n=1 Tax=candidate division WOR-1 bacterium RIFOXYB2_FULL_37_13 TaxID=1802579 RepID=A0A1F4SKR9_UNCSA|nr:MAG: hypothetical protein A2310_00630 [candidate division WOR-1 bacterium RIFOXYB2_FULL_37_13]OGC36688.1 MAG: hypothetical protein A3J90_00615 [candidate division WOR-1 bacterium RIFOXYC2_FULL_37_10]